MGSTVDSTGEPGPGGVPPALQPQGSLQGRSLSLSAWDARGQLQDCWEDAAMMSKHKANWGLTSNATYFNRETKRPLSLGLMKGFDARTQRTALVSPSHLGSPPGPSPQGSFLTLRATRFSTRSAFSQTRVTRF